MEEMIREDGGDDVDEGREGEGIGVRSLCSLARAFCCVLGYIITHSTGGRRVRRGLTHLLIYADYSSINNTAPLII